jgi:hypothetical protein
VKKVFALVYVLVLVTQLPHIWYAYAALERPGFTLAHVTAAGAAIALELATGVFTLRIVQGTKQRWTRPGLAFFIVASVVAGGYYYAWWPFAFDRLMPAFATIALPIALALFAHEFGVEVKQDALDRKREAKRSEPKPEPVAVVLPFTCPVCERPFTSQQALAGHMKAHNNGNGTSHERIPEMVEVGG